MRTSPAEARRPPGEAAVKATLAIPRRWSWTGAGLTGSVDLKSLFFAGFLSAGHFKLDPRLAWLTIDLTLLLVSLSALTAWIILLRNRGRLPLPIIWMGLFFFLLAFPALWTHWTPYAVDKVARLFTVTLMAALLPLILFRTVEDLGRLFNAITLLALLFSLDGFITLFTSTENLHRLTAWNANTIALGRAAGMAALWVAICAVERKVALQTALLLLGALAAVMFWSGSRGPILALLVSLGLTSVLFYLKRGGTLLRLAIAGGVMFVFVAQSSAIAPDWSAERIYGFARGDWGSSEHGRLEAYQRAWQQIAGHPWGIGWGGFERLHYLAHPHNTVLEVLVEGGWLVGGCFVALLLAAVRRAQGYAAHSSSVASRALFAFLIYSLAMAMVSDSLNDRWLMPFFALSLASAPGRIRQLRGSAGTTAARPPLEV